jgi:hypothetical protein
MDIDNNIELGPLEMKRNVMVEEGPAFMMGESSKRNTGPIYGHSTGSSGRRNLDVSLGRYAKIGREMRDDTSGC